MFIIFKDKKPKTSRKAVGIKVFLTFLLGDRRLRIRIRINTSDWGDPDPDPGGPKTSGSVGFGSGSATLPVSTGTCRVSYWSGNVPALIHDMVMCVSISTGTRDYILTI
jgi:hypothetical protein